MGQLTVGDWIGIIAFILAIPVGVMSHVLGHHFLRHLENRRLVRRNATRQQAIRMYNTVKAFHNRARDRYAYYLLLAGWAVICAVASSTCIILISFMKPDVDLLPGPLGTVLLVFAVTFALFAVLLMMGIYETSRQLARFDDYKAELEQQWGPIDENPEA
jgi:hypothetical protein